MRRFTIIAAAASVLLTGSVMASQTSARQGCKTHKCERRVALRAFAKAHGGCRSDRCVQRVHGKYWKRQQHKIPAAMKGTLYRLRMCESGGNYAINTGNGFYGAYQYVPSTWFSIGGTTMPHLASPAEQDVRTARFYPGNESQWPVCSRRA